MHCTFGKGGVSGVMHCTVAEGDELSVRVMHCTVGEGDVGDGDALHCR